MTEIADQISFAEFSSNLASIVDRVISEGTSVVIEKENGERVEIKPVTAPKSSQKAITKEDDEAFLSAAGGWADVDTDTLLKNIYESRTSSRPPVDL